MSAAANTKFVSDQIDTGYNTANPDYLPDAGGGGTLSPAMAKADTGVPKFTNTGTGAG